MGVLPKGFMQRFRFSPIRFNLGFCLGLLGFYVGVGLGVVYASDSNRERGYQEVMSNLKLRELVELTAGDQKFTAVFNDAPKNPEKKAVLILHDMGGYPDQQPVIRNLRLEFPEHQWSALALQLPIRESGAKLDDYLSLFPDAAARIQAGLDFLTKREFKILAVVGYGLGSSMALYALAENSSAIKAVVTISLPVYEASTVSTLALLKKIPLPVLDIYAERDAENVSSTAKDRRLAAKDNTSYRQLRLEGEDHHFQHEQGLLVKRIYSWLNTVVNMTSGQ